MQYCNYRNCSGQQTYGQEEIDLALKDMEAVAKRGLEAHALQREPHLHSPDTNKLLPRKN